MTREAAGGLSDRPPPIWVRWKSLSSVLAVSGVERIGAAMVAQVIPVGPWRSGKGSVTP